MKKLTVALDWSPNSNHSGLYVARSKQFFAEAGLDVTILSPHTDGYKRTPASRVADGSAHFAVTPSETVISHHTWPEDAPGGPKPKIQAIATLLQSSTSAVVTLKSSGIDRPAKLDGKRYASYGARYEGRIVQALIRADGGRGDYVEDTPPMLGIWDTLLKGEADATWVFLGWEGVEARRAGVELFEFKLEDYSIPYGYSPVLVANPDLLRTEPDTVRAFLAAAARGYELAAAHPDEAARALFDLVAADTVDAPLPKPLDLDMLIESQKYVSQHYLTPDGRWGVTSPTRWDAFLSWLNTNGLLTTKVQSRREPGPATTTLDGLRAGDVGERLAPELVPSAADVATNAFLPGASA